MQALGLIETKGLIAAIESADAMLKAANVNLLEKTYVGGGLVSIVVTGDVGAVKAAVEAGEAAVRKINSALLVSQHVIPRPHEDLNNIIISASPIKDRDTTTYESAKTEAEQEKEFKSIEEDTEEILDLAFETVIEIVEEETVESPLKVEDAVVEHSEDTKSLIEKITSSLKPDYSELHNKEAIDNMVFKQGLEKTIEILSKFKVIQLRNLAREYKDFGIAGRTVSKADKNLLLTEFRKYYENNKNNDKD